MIAITKPKARLLALTDNNCTAVFRFEDLLKGMGVSLGNTLVRTLLNFIPGYAPQSYNITVGATSVGKYDAIPSCIENEVDLSRNISSLRLTSTDNNVSKFTLVYTSADSSSSSEIKAKDLKLISAFDKSGQPIRAEDSIKILNGDLVLLNRGSKNGESIKLEIRCGYNAYFSSSNEPNKVDEDERNFMTVTSKYSPVIKAHFVVSEGDSRLYENLEITVGTTGAVSPSEALSTACKIINVYSNMLGRVNEFFPIPRSYEGNGVKSNSERLKEKIKEVDDIKYNDDSAPIEDAGFSSIVYNYLKVKGVKTMGQISMMAADGVDELADKLFNSRSGVYTSDAGTFVESDVQELKKELLEAGFKRITDKE